MAVVAVAITSRCDWRGGKDEGRAMGIIGMDDDGLAAAPKQACCGRRLAFDPTDLNGGINDDLYFIVVL